MPTDRERQKLPEFAPLREYNKEFKIDVVVYDKDDNIIRQEVMDYGNYQDRIWLGKISFHYWGIGCIVETRMK